MPAYLPICVCVPISPSPLPSVPVFASLHTPLPLHPNHSTPLAVPPLQALSTREPLKLTEPCTHLGHPLTSFWCWSQCWPVPEAFPESSLHGTPTPQLSPLPVPYLTSSICCVCHCAAHICLLSLSQHVGHKLCKIRDSAMWVHCLLYL